MSYPSGTPEPYDKPPLPASGAEVSSPSTSWSNEPPQPTKRTGCGWGSCLVGCLVIGVLGAISCGGLTYYFMKRIPNDLRNGAVKAVRESDLAEEDKKVVIEQLDRVHADFTTGKIGFRDVGKLVETLTNSPLMPVMLAKAAKKKYVDPSGLSDEEKQDADMTFQRVTRGIVEKKIPQSELETALNMISDGAGNQRRLKDSLSDDEVRAFLTECKRVVDEAEIPEEPFEIDIGAEFKRAVDEAMGTTEKTLPAEKE